MSQATWYCLLLRDKLPDDVGAGNRRNCLLGATMMGAERDLHERSSNERAFLEKPATAGGHGHRARQRLGDSGVSTRETGHLHRSFTHSSRSFSESAQSTYLLQVNGGGWYER